MEPHFQTLVCLSPPSFLLLSLTQFPLLYNLGVVPPFKVVLRLLFRASRGVSWGGKHRVFSPSLGPCICCQSTVLTLMLNLPPQLGKVWKVPGTAFSLWISPLSFLLPSWHSAPNRLPCPHPGRNLSRPLFPPPKKNRHEFATRLERLEARQVASSGVSSSPACSY